jgi:hypothetical protein
MYIYNQIKLYINGINNLCTLSGNFYFFRKPVGGFLLNENIGSPDVITNSFSTYSSYTVETNTLIPSWFIKGQFRLYDGLSANYTGTETYIPSSNNQYLVFVVGSTVPITYIRQPITLNIGTYMVSFYYILGPIDPYTDLLFQIFFNNIEIGLINSINNTIWTYYSVTFPVSSLTTGDFNYKIIIL